MNRKRRHSPLSNTLPGALFEWLFDKAKWIGAFLMGVAALAVLMLQGMNDES